MGILETGIELENKFSLCLSSIQVRASVCIKENCFFERNGENEFTKKIIKVDPTYPIFCYSSVFSRRFLFSVEFYILHFWYNLLETESSKGLLTFCYENF